MLRLSDGRMSGTAGGTVVLHISPESAVPDSPFGVVQDGDVITCDVEERRLHLEVTDEELKGRIEARKAALLGERGGGDEEAEATSSWVASRTRRGYRGLYERNVNQAHLGADFDFLTARGPQ